MKWGGGKHHKGGCDYSRPVYFINLLACPIIRFWWEGPVWQGPAKQEYRYFTQNVRGENGGFYN